LEFRVFVQLLDPDHSRGKQDLGGQNFMRRMLAKKRLRHKVSIRKALAQALALFKANTAA
jgi:uncharacterized protein (DUF2267 family)